MTLILLFMCCCFHLIILENNVVAEALILPGWRRAGVLEGGGGKERWLLCHPLLSIRDVNAPLPGNEAVRLCAAVRLEHWRGRRPRPACLWGTNTAAPVCLSVCPPGLRSATTRRTQLVREPGNAPQGPNLNASKNHSLPEFLRL